MRLTLVFVISFVCNFLWEHLHAVLYVAYKGGPITDFILLRATLGDAVMLTALAALVLYTPFCGRREWAILPLGVVLAVGIEFVALATGRWEYAAAMPLVPLLGVGLSPVLQLPLIGYLALRASGNKQP